MSYFKKGARLVGRERIHLLALRPWGFDTVGDIARDQPVCNCVLESFVQCPGYDTWHKGHFLESWANPRVLGELHQAFAHYDEADIGRALSKTVELFRWVAKETAADLGYRYPETDHERVTAWIAAHSE